MIPKAVPVSQKPRTVAYYLQGLEQYVEEETFEEVPEGEPVSWSSLLVVQPKPKFNSVV